MATFLKDVLKANRYRLPDGRWVSYTASDVSHLTARVGEMVKAFIVSGEYKARFGP